MQKEFSSFDIDDTQLNLNEDSHDTADTFDSKFVKPQDYLQQKPDHQQEEGIEQQISNDTFIRFTNSSNSILIENDWRNSFKDSTKMFVGSTMIKSLASSKSFKVFSFQSRFLTNLALKNQK